MNGNYTNAVFILADRHLTFEEQEEAAKEAIKNPNGRNVREAFMLNLARRIQAKLPATTATAS